MNLPLIEQARQHPERTALLTPEGRFTYGQLLADSGRVAAALLAGRQDLAEARVAFLTPPGYDYVAVQWGIWRAGGIAVPLAVSHPPPELAYVLSDADAEVVVAHPTFAERLRPLATEQGRTFWTTPTLLDQPEAPLPTIDPERRAMMVYTSGTTGRPKGVVTTYRNIRAQVTTLLQAWGWQADDHILHVLPLHHVHGIINVLTCALWAGAVCEMLPKFEAEAVWQRFIDSRPTLFMAVPTIYSRLIAAWEAAPPERQQAMSAAAQAQRLMVSGSAALPVSVLERWREISGHTLLERYGMTEIGMGLSNPLQGERRPGSVGRPLPGVRLRLVDEQGAEIVGEDTPGEIQVQGESVFKEYWRRPEATRAAFKDGWFCTGDTALREQGYYRILGRNSVDIIKTGGYKVSALEIEEVLRTHPAVQACAVVGIPDEVWGEQVAAGVVIRSGQSLTAAALQQWAAERLAPYKTPRHVRFLEELPRNAMGKVTKPTLHQQFQADDA